MRISRLHAFCGMATRGWCSGLSQIPSFGLPLFTQKNVDDARKSLAIKTFGFF